MLRIYLLGGLYATVDDAPLQIPAGPDLAGLWAYLLLHPRQRISRSQLAFTLWPDSSEEQALARSRQCLHRLQQLLPPAPAERPWLLVESRSLGWNPDADAWLDVDQFRRDCATNSVEQIAQGLALYRGELLAGAPGEWLAAERARLRLEYLEALRRLMEIEASGGNYAAALAAAERLRQREPYSEDALRWCMRLRYLGGDRAAALRQYNDFAAQAEQISPETSALRASIAAGTELAAMARELPAPRILEQARPQAEQKQAARQKFKLGWRWLAVGALAILLALLVAVLGIERPFQPLKTITLAGPQLIEDTWIVSTLPNATSAGDLDKAWLYVDLHDGRGPVNPRLPFARYPAARPNLANTIVSDALFRFKLDQLPAHCRVKSARLTLYLEPDNLCTIRQGWPPVTLAAYRLLRQWDVESATFNYPWSEPGLRPGADYEPTPVDQQAVLSPGPLTFDLTAAIPAWQNGQNYGIAIRVADAPAGCSPYWVNTVDHPDPAHRPRLFIQYR